MHPIESGMVDRRVVSSVRNVVASERADKQWENRRGWLEFADNRS